MPLTKNEKPMYQANDSLYNDAVPCIVIKSETKYEHKYLVEYQDGTRSWIDEDDVHKFRKGY
jgi:hypothetical protein